MTPARLTALVHLFDRHRHKGLPAAISAVVGADRRWDRPPAILDAAIREIRIGIARVHGVTVPQILSRDRSPRVVAARFECFWSIRRLNRSYPAIGQIMRRHWTSVISGVRRFDAMLAADPILRARVVPRPVVVADEGKAAA